MELKLYLRMLQRGWWMILLTALVAVAISLTISYFAVPQYQAVARFIITPGASATSSAAVIDSLNTLDRRSVVATYAEVMNSQKILLGSQESLQLPEAMREEFVVQAVVLPDANVLELTVTGPEPSSVAGLANTIGYQSILFSHSLNMTYALNFLDEATPPSQPISPQPLRDAAVALVLGLVAGSTIAIVSEQIRIPLEAYRQRGRIDSVTGIYNARYFRQLLSEELVKDPDGSLSLGIVELSGLRELQETLLPAALQYLLRKVTGTLKNELRGNDIIGRWGDISFVVLLPTTPGKAAKRTLDRIYQALSQEIVLDAYDITINVDPHIGGAVYSNSITAQELINKAEDSLVEAHSSGATPVFLWMMNSPFWVQET
jgi:diguanylate cyclase (GGDEF)-like protein